MKRTTLALLGALSMLTGLLGCGGGGGTPAPPTTITVTGTVETDGSPATPIEGAHVVLGGKATDTDANGMYKFDNVAVTARATVTVPLSASKDQFASLLDDNVQLTLGENKQLDTIRLTARPNSGSVSGTVLQAGKPVVNAKVTVGTPDFPLEARTDDDGKFLITGVFTGQQPYTVERTGYLTTSGTVDNVVQSSKPTELGTVSLVLSTSTATVTGTVRDSDGNAIASATVTLGSATDQTDAQGAYELTNIQVGAQTVKATKEGFLDSQREVEITGSQGAVDFVLFRSDEESLLPSGPFNVTGQVRDSQGAPVSGATVTALEQPADAQQGSFTTGTDGRFYLFVPAGSYNIQGSKGGLSGSLAATVPPGGQIVTGLVLTLS